MSATTRFLRKRRERQEREPQTKIQKVVNNVGIFGLFATVGLLILGIFKIYNLNTFMFGLISTIALISLGCFLIIPWLRTFEKGEYKKISLTFIIVIAVCTILWISCVYLGIQLYKDARADVVDHGALISTLKLMKITTIISLQLIISSTIASTIIRYKKEMIVFQAITYMSNLYFDFYVTTFLLCLSVKPSGGLIIAEELKYLFTKFMLVLFVLSIVYMILSSKIMQMVDARRFKNAVEDYNERTEVSREKEESNQYPDNSIEARLAKLQSMLDKNIITKEEYDKKRDEILKEI